MFVIMILTTTEVGGRRGGHAHTAKQKGEDRNTSRLKTRKEAQKGCREYEKGGKLKRKEKWGKSSKARISS